RAAPGDGVRAPRHRPRRGRRAEGGVLRSGRRAPVRPRLDAPGLRDPGALSRRGHAWGRVRVKRRRLSALFVCRVARPDPRRASPARRLSGEPRLKPAYVAVHVEEHGLHWYFRGRRTLIHGVLRRLLPKRPLRLLDIGCGTGNLLSTLKEFGEAVGM